MATSARLQEGRNQEGVGARRVIAAAAAVLAIEVAGARSSGRRGCRPPSCLNIGVRLGHFLLLASDGVRCEGRVVVDRPRILCQRSWEVLTGCDTGLVAGQVV